MDERSIERIKNANFSHAVRGYDRHEVDEFLRELADWLERGGEDEAASEAVRNQLERIGERTAGILTEAHEAAEAIRADAAEEARQKLVDANVTSETVRSQADEYSETTHAEADAYSAKTRREADEYAERVRAEADAKAAEIREASERNAERIVAEAETRRQEVEATIAELEQRREAVVAELERLASGITGTATQHRHSSQDAAGNAAPKPDGKVGADDERKGEDEANRNGSAAEGAVIEQPDEAETEDQPAVQRPD